MGGEQANVDDTEHGLTASEPGSFVLNLADARWMRSEIAGQWTDFEPPEGFEHYGIAPDVITMAKALGNGVPIGACWARRDVAAAFVPGDHGSTYGGQPLAAAAARAVLAIMERDHLAERAAVVGERLRAASS
jgi:hypothetical protein